MEIKYQKPRYLIVLIPFGLLLLFGIISLLIYRGKYPEVTNISIIFGTLGTILGLLMLFYGLVYIYETKFDTKGIDVKKGKKEVFIDLDNISDMEYEKPSLINYLTTTGSKLFPGFLRVNIKKDNSKRKVYLIRLKHKDYKKLPKKYKDLIKYPI